MIILPSYVLNDLMRANKNINMGCTNHFMKAFVVLILFFIGFSDTYACEWNFFYIIDLPQNWKESKCVHALDKFSPSPLLGNECMSSDESRRYQVAYSIVIVKEADLKEYIQHHVGELEDVKLYENLCYYKQERFHGYNALSYTFGGQWKSVKCVGKIYAFHAHGFTFLFVNKFLPNKSGQREEVDVWKTLKWQPVENWKIKLPN